MNGIGRNSHQTVIFVLFHLTSLCPCLLMFFLSGFSSGSFKFSLDLIIPSTTQLRDLHLHSTAAIDFFLHNDVESFCDCHNFLVKALGIISNSSISLHLLQELIILHNLVELFPDSI